MYISRLCYDVSVRLSVCLSVSDGSALWSRCMPGRGEGSSRAMLATAMPSCFVFNTAHQYGPYSRVSSQKAKSHVPHEKNTAGLLISLIVRRRACR